VTKSKTETPRWKPNSVPLADRLFSLALALALLAYGISGLVQNKFFVTPPKSRIGLVLSDRPAWLLAASLFVGAAVACSVVIDHYDKRSNEHLYRRFRKVAVSVGLCLLLAALVSAFYVGLVS
jgi:hypothetical protein